VKRVKNQFAVGLIFCGLSVIFLVTALFCQFYPKTLGSGEFALTVYPYAKYVWDAVLAMSVTLVVGLVGLITGRENKPDTELLTVTVLPEELKGEKRKVNKLRSVGYVLYGLGIAIFIIGLALSYFEATNFLSVNVLDGKAQAIFLKSIIPWIVIAIILWAIATLPVTISYKREASIVDSQLVSSR